MPKDLAFFKAETIGNPVIMERKTFESLKGPLPNRENIILTNNPNYSTDKKIKVFTTIEDILNYCSTYEKINFIGGSLVYKQVTPIADIITLTKIEASDNEADNFFQNFDKSLYEYKLIGGNTENGITYRWIKYYKNLEVKI